MTNLVRLAVVLFRGSGTGITAGSGRRRKRSQLGNILLFLFLGIYMVGIMSASSAGLYSLLAANGLQDLMIGLYLSMGTVLVFLFGILYVISVFYFTGDIEKLLPLPLQADEIIGAKLAVTAAWEYLYLAVLVLPPLVVFGILSQAGAGYFLFLAGVFLLLPVVPLCLASMLVMLIMRFTPLARNKDRFNMVSGILAMLLALGFVFGTQSMARFDEMDLAQIISAGSASIAKLTTTVFPGTSFAVGALTAPDALQQLAQLGLLLLIASAAVLVTFRMARLLYFKGVVGVGASAARRRRLSSAELSKAGQGGSAFWTYWLKDVRILIRTPVFFMNNVLMNFLWPVFFVLPMLTSAGGSGGSGALIELARGALADPDGRGAALSLVICFVIACFISGTNGISESALSREGETFYIMKIIPMSWWRQIMAKVTAGLLFSLAGTLLPLVLAVAFLRPPAWLALGWLAVLPGGILMPNLGGFFFELFWPKLHWEHEQKAVKQNLNVLYGMALALLLAALLAGPAVALGLSAAGTALLVGLGSLVVAAAEIVILRRILPGRFAAIEP
ncbi:MAG: hypothetical protein GX112_00780 [Clostridiaceae bacterium]|jgi:ABC-2 type transport system permease protein|nr:hypothetical protein [Clostridiaceae bacterium]